MKITTEKGKITRTSSKRKEKQGKKKFFANCPGGLEYLNICSMAVAKPLGGLKRHSTYTFISVTGQGPRVGEVITSPAVKKEVSVEVSPIFDKRSQRHKTGGQEEQFRKRKSKTP